MYDFLSKAENVFLLPTRCKYLFLHPREYAFRVLSVTGQRKEEDQKVEHFVPIAFDVTLE